MAKNISLRRQKLFARDPHCFWCGRECVDVRSPDGVIPDNAATLDHLRSRAHPKRKEKGGGTEERTVLACMRCNRRRGIEDENLKRLAWRLKWEEEHLLALLEASVEIALERKRKNGNHEHRPSLVQPSDENS